MPRVPGGVRARNTASARDDRPRSFEEDQISKDRAYEHPALWARLRRWPWPESGDRVSLIGAQHTIPLSRDLALASVCKNRNIVEDRLNQCAKIVCAQRNETKSPARV